MAFRYAVVMALVIVGQQVLAQSSGGTSGAAGAGPVIEEMLGRQAERDREQHDAASSRTDSRRPDVVSNSMLPALPEPSVASSDPGRAWRYSATGRGQTTPGRTTSLDQFAIIGGRSSVRGFDGDSVLIAYSGWTLRNELSTAFQVESAQGSFYLGLDFGHVWGPSDADLIGRSLPGAAIGLRGRWRSMNLDLAAAIPLRMPDGFRTSSLGKSLSATYEF